MKRIIILALCFIMMTALCPHASAEPGDNVCEIVETGVGYSSLADALNTVGSGETIRLLANINHNAGIVIDNKHITFDLNGYTLNVDNTSTGIDPIDSSGLCVTGFSTVDYVDSVGTGAFNVAGYYGVFASCDEWTGTSVTVTNATGTMASVVAEKAEITVKGNVTSNSAGSFGVYAIDDNTKVTVEGNVFASGDESVGLGAYEGAAIEVKGNVNVDGEISAGVRAEENSEITVDGNITVSGNNGVGVSIYEMDDNPSIVNVGGIITAEKYVLFENESGTIAEYSFLDGNDAVDGNYIFYIMDGGNESCLKVAMFAGGSGSAADPFLVSDGTHLYNVRYRCGSYFTQVCDITLGGIFSQGDGWVPIGLGEDSFLGVYDGDGFEIRNLDINRENENDIGLFGAIGFDATVKNVKLIDVDIKGNRNVGALAGINTGSVLDSSATGNVYGKHSYIGGLVGDNFYDDAIINGCYTDIDVEGGVVTGEIRNNGNKVGGLAGSNSGTVEDSYAICDDVAGHEYVGGLVGENSGSIEDSYATGTVMGDVVVGGLSGNNTDVITESYFTGTVTSAGDYIGGLVGYNSGWIEVCHADATVTGYWYVGGLAGISQKSIRDSYSSGSVTGASSVGGLVGYNYSDDDSPGIGSSYSLCAVTGEGVVGGLVGWNIIGISESFAKGNVNKIASANPENNVCFGGLVGMNYGPIENSYA